MTRAEKMKYYRRRQIALVIGIIIVLGAIITAIVMIFSGDDDNGSSKEKTVTDKQDTVLSSSKSDNKEDKLVAEADKVIDEDDEELCFEFAVDEITIKVGEINNVILINETDETDVVWESSNASVATVDDGEVLGIGEGSCDITAEIESLGLSAELRVYVEGEEKTLEERIVVENGITYVDGILIANKSYSLPQDYDPGFLPETQEAFSEMQADASAEGLYLVNNSGYRSYWTQSTIYNNYVSMDGQAAADRYSARPGHSEHQTGLALDLNSIDMSFENTPEHLWVKENAHKYGFIIRYPEDKEHITGYQYEPWHLRYLGVEIATAVYESGLCLEEYLGIDSVYAE